MKMEWSFMSWKLGVDGLLIDEEMIAEKHVLGQEESQMSLELGA
jgi:hypothetical protein